MASPLGVWAARLVVLSLSSPLRFDTAQYMVDFLSSANIWSRSFADLFPITPGGEDDWSLPLPGAFLYQWFL